MNQLFQNGFFSFEVVSSQEIASNNTCYLTSACTRCMRHALSFVTFLSSIFYLLNTLCGSLDLMCMSLFILQCNSVLTIISVLREGGSWTRRFGNPGIAKKGGGIWPMFSQQKVFHRKCSTQLKSLGNHC